MSDLISENFFFIDSDHLNDVKTHLYGYYIEDDIVTNDTLTKETVIHPESATGAYIYLRKEGSKIEILQSFGGGYGLFLFRKGSYFALSNSFMLMLDHLKHKFPLSFNEANADSYIVEDLTALGYRKTMVNEITLLPKYVKVHIDCQSKTIDFEKIHFGENSIPLNTPEGMKILDQWYDKWTGFIRTLDRQSDQISVDLSGGMDSRSTFLLFLGSGIDMSHIRVNSAHDTLHTHAEDYQIASAIGSHFGFSLNKSLPSNPIKRLSLEDTIHISYYTKLGFHKQMYYKRNISQKPKYTFTGAAGECVRSSHWDIKPSEFAKNKLRRSKNYKTIDFTKSVEHSLGEAFQELAEDYHISDPDSREIMWKWYANVRSRYHFGMADVEAYMSNNIRISPLFDPLLYRLSTLSPENDDRNLLFIMMLVRYCPALLDFPFEGGRSYNKETIAYAKIINSRFPRSESLKPHANKKAVTVYNNFTHLLGIITPPDKLESSDNFFNQFITNYKKAPARSTEAANEFSNALFSSSTFKNFFLQYYPPEVYEKAESYAHSVSYFPLQELYPIISIVKVLQDIEISQSTRPNPLFNQLNHLIFKPSSRENSSYQGLRLKQAMEYFETARIDIKFNQLNHLIFKPSSRENSSHQGLRLKQAMEYFKTSRIDIKNNGRNRNNLEIRLSDSSAKNQTPAWYTNDSGIGHMITASHGLLTLHLTCKGEGNLEIVLRGLDCRTPDNHSKRLPLWIDYTLLTINGKTIFDKTTPVWHDAPFRYSMSAHDADTFTISLKWQPHGYPAEEFTSLFNLLLQTIK